MKWRLNKFMKYARMAPVIFVAMALFGCGVVSTEDLEGFIRQQDSIPTKALQPLPEITRVPEVRTGG
jgi:Tfp pilus assembly protein PilP